MMSASRNKGRLSFLVMGAVTLALLAGMVSAKPNWEGIWTDNCLDNCVGGALFVCVDGDVVEGTYSDIGHIRGTLSNDGRKVSGRWYEAGFVDRNSGGFDWEFFEGDNFIGTWWYGTDECVRYKWNSKKLSGLQEKNRAFCIPTSNGEDFQTLSFASATNGSPAASSGSPATPASPVTSISPLSPLTVSVNSSLTPATPASPGSSGSSGSSGASSGSSSGLTLEGTWKLDSSNDVMYICLDGDGSYRASYSIDNVKLYYTLGKQQTGEFAGSGSTWSNAQAPGATSIELIILATPTDIIQLHWDVSHPALANEQYPNLDLHTIRRWVRIDDSISDSECRINEPLSTTGFAGVWQEDKYGGRLYLCTDGSNIWGVYSEIGTFRGVLSADGSVASGTWAEAGNEYSDSGAFVWTLDTENFQLFTGVYASNTDDDQDTWSAIRLDVGSSFDNDKCLTPSASGSLIGSWFYGPLIIDTLDICSLNSGSSGSSGSSATSASTADSSDNSSDNNDLNEATFNGVTYTAIEGSYTKQSGKPGYIRGYLLDDGVTFQINWYEEDAAGISFAVLTSPGTMAQSWWRLPSAPDLDYKICESKNTASTLFFKDHAIRKYTRISAIEPKRSECRRNEDLLSQTSALVYASTDSTVLPSPSTQNSSDASSLSLFFSPLLVLLAVFLF
eukprot:TRINITY_DN1133_c0_g1_i2.p1 TRINITY_DN1133_c0_g1~~TRINITY_DN1133_c0_g1_i2.p1  ORF type:complete len:710 (-),score=354.41 TRINITY_DN1133_c0_g1_i2:123-2144(-)